MTDKVRAGHLSLTAQLDHNEKWLGEITRNLWHLGIEKTGPVMGPSIILSVIAREMRRKHGLAATQAMFRAFADTMPEAAATDITSPGEPPASD